MNETISKDQPLESVAFTGNASDYFGIWIVNILLTLITLGIYSAWAKVRTQTYFLNHTSVDGQPFNYHATGKQILVGRIIALLVLVAIGFLSNISPAISMVVSLGIVSVLPWVINRSTHFKARMTSYRNVRFQWAGNYKKTLWLYVLAPVLLIVTLFLALPFLSRASARYFGGRLKFGTTAFSVSELRLAPFFRAFFIMASLPLVLGILGFLMIKAIPSLANAAGFVIPLAYVLFIAATTAYMIMVRNILIDHMSLSDAMTFQSTLNPLTVVGIAFTNWLAIVCTLGLAFPWAKVRMYRYLCEQTHYRKFASFDRFRDDLIEKQSAVSEGLSDFESLEIGV